jgi:hypothetical protein
MLIFKLMQIPEKKVYLITEVYHRMFTNDAKCLYCSGSRYTIGIAVSTEQWRGVRCSFL